MKNITVKDVINICNGKLICGDVNITCENFCKDTRAIQENDVYVGLKGEHSNGNLLYKDALEKGASVCILQGIEIEEEVILKYKDRAIILVEDTIVALQEIARYKRSLYNIPVIAVTGSVGKTSTKDIIASVLSRKYNVLKTEGNFNNHIGLPLTVLRLEEHTAMVVEMGMNALGEIRLLTNIAKPTTAVITNIGTSHIGELGSRENILKAKLEILEGMKKDGTVIINNDNDMLNSWAKGNGDYKIYTYGIEEKSDLVAKNINLSENGSTYVVDIKDKEYNISVPIGGKHFIYNSLSAISVGLAYDVEVSEIIKGIKEFELTKKRMDVIKNENGITIIDDSYNASYDSNKAALEYLNSVSGKRKIAVLGDMFELGAYSKELHEKVGDEVIKNDVDILITVGDNSKYISKKAKEQGMKENNIYECNDRDMALGVLEKILEKEDVVLVKASNGMKFEYIVQKLV